MGRRRSTLLLAWWVAVWGCQEPEPSDPVVPDEPPTCGDEAEGHNACEDPACMDAEPCADVDGDEVVAWADCDDDDAAVGAVAADADCDGVRTADDCDDGDVALGARSADTDCDGVLAADDVCDGHDDRVDADADGLPDACDCDASDVCGLGATCVEAADGTVCACSEGHLPSADPTTCDPVDCGGLDAPESGAVDAPDTRFGATATYACAAGHDLVGDASRVCQADGAWAGAAATCAIVDCGPLDAPDDGAVDAPETTYDAVATYTCTAAHRCRATCSAPASPRGTGAATPRCAPRCSASGT
jgi:hypothetical protein